MKKNESSAAAVDAFEGVAADLAGAQLFDPSGMGRPFKDWVEVPAVSAEAWPSIGEAALAFTAG